MREFMGEFLKREFWEKVKREDIKNIIICVCEY